MTARRLAAALAVGGLAALAGCGSSGGGGASGSPSGASTAASSTPASTAASTPASPSTSPSTPAAAPFAITSPVFRATGRIPARYTCDGANVSPPLAWGGVPAGTARLALVVDDPDAVGGTYTHWVVVDIPPRTTRAAEGTVPADGRQVANSSGGPGYIGPCPPSGTHRYRFTLYALPGPVTATTLPAVLTALDRDATARTRLVGTYR